MGDVNHGLQIITQFSKLTKKYPFIFAFKFQFRNLDTFVHPDFKKRMDIKYVKRFSDAKLSEEDFRKLKKGVEKNGCISICTPFDEKSVVLIEEMNFDVIKIASCSFADWPLLERIATSGKPVIASTAGSTLAEIDRVVSYFQHRKIPLVLMHCIGIYPTKPGDLQLNQINVLQGRYPNLNIGFSTHEEPENYTAVMLAIAKGAREFEKHVGIESNQYPLNEYSATPEQIKKWLDSAVLATHMDGVINKRAPFSKKELEDLRQFKRGVFAKKDMPIGEKIDLSNTFLAFPNKPGQLLSNDMSKYASFITKKNVLKNNPIYNTSVKKMDIRENVNSAVEEVEKMLKKSKIALPSMMDFELSHHYGIQKFREYGATIITVVNRNYAKKLVVMFPNQKHPEHYHKKKEETFHILYGDFILITDGTRKHLSAGNVITIERGVKHSFTTKIGGIFEEISTKHVASDSYYTDSKITSNKERKTKLTYGWVD